MMQTGLLAWNEKTRQLFISEPVAMLMMRDADTWTGFLYAVFEVQQLTLSQKAWNDYIQHEQLKAARAALKENPRLSRFDIERIRRARRDEIALSDMEPPRIDGYEFFIVSETTDVEPQVIVVGHYDAATDRVEMEQWDRVRLLLEQAKAGNNK